MEVSVQLHVPGVLPPKKESLVTTGYDAGCFTTPILKHILKKLNII
jgi:hypothetical protein